MILPASTLICFAVREEVGRSLLSTGAEVLITGMGRKNAEESLQRRLAAHLPEFVLTCGFAGGLNPQLSGCTVIFAAEEQSGLTPALSALGGVPARFHCAGRVAITAAEKQLLWQTTGADAVEMESEVIRGICRQHHIPSATIRVISDAAQEDLPLDFNALMTARQQINFARLAWQLVKSPATIPRLLELRKRTAQARDELGDVLAKLLATQPGRGD
jgi:adenosylhomocysteine nucleosidase